MKKYLLPISIVAGIGVLYFLAKRRNKVTPTTTPSTTTPMFVDSPQKKALRDALLTKLRDMQLDYLQNHQVLMGHTTGTTTGTIDYTVDAYNNALKIFNCMLPELQMMSLEELTALLDYYNNGVPQDFNKYQVFIEATKNYPIAFSDNPCGTPSVKPESEILI